MKTKNLPKTAAKDTLLDAAYELMLAKGFVATTVDEICEKAKVTKGCFFHYFESKEDLAKTLLERVCGSSKPMKAQEDLPTDPLKRVYAHVDFAIQMSKECDAVKGCLVGTFAQELSDTHPEIREICAEGFKKMAGTFARDIEEAKAQYAPKASLNGKGMAEHFLAVLQGSLILAKAHQDSKIVTRSLEHFKQYLHELFGR